MTKPSTGSSMTTGEAEAYERGRASMQLTIDELRASLESALRELGKYSTDAGYWKGRAEGLELLYNETKADLAAALSKRTRR